MTRLMLSLLTCLLPVLAAAGVVQASPNDAPQASWPEFRGPTGQGDAGAEDLPLQWSETEGVVWKTPLVGQGWSSPVVAEGRIWVTAAETTAADEAQRAAMLKTVESLPVGDQFVAFAEVKLVALELDLATGSQLRRVELFTIAKPGPIHGLNSYASPTPILNNGRCYCHFGTFGTACVDTTTGEVVWRRVLALDHVVGPGSSPVLYLPAAPPSKRGAEGGISGIAIQRAGDSESELKNPSPSLSPEGRGILIIPCDGADRQFVVGLDAATGEPAWQVDRPPIRNTDGDNRKAFSTPLLIHAAGRDQAVIPGAQWFVAYDPTSGEEIWRVDHGGGFSNVPRPVYDGRLLYLCTGFGKPQLWAVDADGAGDVTDTNVVWRQPQQIPAMSTPVVVDGRIYLISDGGVASCLDAATGESLWRERMPGKYSASPLTGAGRVYFCSHEGRTTVIAAGDEFEVLAKNDLEGMLMASPAVAEGDLILRTDSHLYRIGAK